MNENLTFGEIYDKYKKLVLKVAYTYTSDLDLAEDVMQDTFMALLRDMSEKGLESEAEYSNIKSWLYTTAKNFALNYGKKAARMVSADAAEESGVIEEPVSESLESEYFGSLEKMRQAELHQRIVSALIEKNPRWHEAIMMVGHLEMSAGEAAHALGMNENAFYAMIHRAKKWIYKEFNAEYEELNRF